MGIVWQVTHDTLLYSAGFAEPVAQGVVTYVPIFPATG
jgi:hypothetical protein